MSNAAEVNGAELFYRAGGASEWRRRDFELVTADHYRVEVPASEVEPPFFEYYVIAVDFLGERHLAFASSTAPQRVPVGEAGPGEPGDVAPSSPAEPAAPPRAGATRVEPAPSTPAPAAARTTAPSPPPATEQAAPRRWQRRIAGPRIEAMGARTLLDVLAGLAELELYRGVDGGYRLGLRGVATLGSVRLSLDGVPMSHPFDGAALLALPAEIIDEVTLHSAPSADLGLEPALAAVVEVRTKRAERAHARLAGGHHVSDGRASSAVDRGSYRVGVASGSDGDVTLSGVAALAYSDGAQLLVGRDAFSDSILPSQAPGPTRDEALQAAAAGSVTLRRMVPGRLVLSGAYAYEERGALIGAVDTYGPDSRSRWHFASGQVEHLHGDPRAWEIGTRLALAVHQRDERLQLTPENFFLGDRDGDGLVESFPDGLRERTRFGTWSIHAGSEARLRLPWGNRLSAGVMVESLAIMDTTLRRNASAAGAAQPMGPTAPALHAEVDATPTQFIAYLYDVWNAFERLELLAGLRVSSAASRGHALAKAIQPQLAARYALSEALTLDATFGASTRAATLRERADARALSLPAGLSRARYLGNPTLVPPVLYGAEIGLVHVKETASMRYASRASFYYQHLADAVVELPVLGAGDVYTQRNAQQRLGAYAESQLGFAARSSARLAVWWGQTMEPAAGDRRVQLVDTPRLGALIELALELSDAADGFVLLRHTGERGNNARTPVEAARAFALPATLTVDLALRTTPVAGMRFGIAAHNVLDAPLRDPAPIPSVLPDGVPHEGAQLLVTAEWSPD